MKNFNALHSLMWIVISTVTLFASSSSTAQSLQTHHSSTATSHSMSFSSLHQPASGKDNTAIQTKRNQALRSNTFKPLSESVPPSVKVRPENADPPVNVSPAFTQLVQGGSAYDQYKSYGLVLSDLGAAGHAVPTAIFDDGGIPAWGGVNSSGNVDLYAQVNGHLSIPGTLNLAVTDFIQVEAGYAAPGTLELDVYDQAGNLLQSRVNGSDGIGPDGRHNIAIRRLAADIASFRVWTPGKDTFGVDQIEFDPPVGAAINFLTITDTNNKPVVGIVCDNLRGMRSDLLDDLTITLPPAYANATVTGTIDGNVGRIVSSMGHATYYPPDEYNEVQEPRDPVAHPEDFTKAAIRPVTLHLTANNRLFTQTIYIARPPVVLVHGINNSPLDWLRFEARITTNPDPDNPNSGLGVDIPFVTVNHNNPSSYSATYGNLWNGNGPVEIAADLLAKRIQKTLDQLHDARPLEDETDTNSPDLSFGYSFTLDTQGRPVHLAARRVDVVGWSYGGVITRWYIASGGDQSNTWYQGASYKAKFANGLPKVAYNQNIRKFITLGSMWRGVPLVNYLNEVQFPSASAVALAQAPVNPTSAYLLRFLNAIGLVQSQVSNVDDVVSLVNKFIQVHAPSMEVMAINSPWQSQMIYQDPFQSKMGPPYPRPFNDDIAYGSVAGDNNAYTKTHGFDPCELLDYATTRTFGNPRSPFPYLRLEYRLDGQFPDQSNAQRNYTDGIVPLWSSAIPGSYKIAPTDHSGYKANTDTINYVVQWLNNAALPQGATLENQWNTSIQSYPDNGQVKTWAYSPVEMAPHTENLLYPQINGIGRINPTALQGTNASNPTINISRLGSTSFGADNFSFVLTVSNSGTSAHDFSIMDVSYYTVSFSPLPLGYYTIKPQGQPFVGSIDFLGPQQFLTVNAHKGGDVSNLFCRVSIQYKDQNENLITPQPRTIRLK